MQTVIFILGTLAHTYVKWLDIKSSREFTTLGIKEKNWLFKDKDGWFSEWRAWIGVGVVTAIVASAFFGFDADPEQSWQPWYSVFGYMISAGFSLAHYFRNKRLIKRRRATLGLQ